MGAASSISYEYENPYTNALLPMSQRLRRAGFVEKQIALSQIAMNYIEGPGCGPPLVLIPAQMGTWRSYYKVLPRLAKNFHVFAVDVRGHGRSSWTPGHYTWDTISNDVAEFIEAGVGRPAIVSGNSSGGIIALWCASRASKWVPSWRMLLCSLPRCRAFVTMTVLCMMASSTRLRPSVIYSTVTWRIIMPDRSCL